MSSFADSLKDQKERQRQSIEKVLRQHADEVVAKETSSINENYKNVLSGYQGAQSQYTTASEFDALDNRRKSFLNQGDMLLKWIPLSSLSDEDKDTLTTEVKRLQSFTDSGYAQKYSDSGEKWQPNGNDEFFSLNQLGENLRNQYGWYKDAEEYETLNKLESISDIQAYIEEQKSAGTVKEGLLQRIERKPKQSAAKAAFYAMDAAATGNPAKLINAIREEKDTGRYINQDKIDRANEFLDSKKYQKYIGNKTYAETMAQAAEWLKTGEIDRADYNWIKNTAYGMDISVSDYETELQRLQNLKGELEAQRDSLESERKGMTLYDNVNGHAYEYYAPENQQRANELTTEINKLQNDIEQAGADIEAITENYHYDEYKQEYEALDTSIKEEIDALANAGKIIDSDGKKYLQFYDPRKKALKEQGYSDDEIDQLVKRRQRIVNREKAIEDMKKWSAFADEHPIISSVLSVPTSLVSGLSAWPETMRGLVEGRKGYEYGVDRYSAGFAPTRYTRSVRDTVTAGIDDKGWQFVYQTAMSVADSAGAMGIGVLTGGASGAAGVVTNVIMSTSAGANAIFDGLEKGYSNGKALFLGISAGLIEAASEKLPLDTILDSIKKGNFVKSLGTSFLAEGGEELASNWANRINDVLVNKSQNEISKAIRAYEDEGYSESEALARALTDMAAEDSLSFLAGGFSGAAMASAGRGIHMAFEKGSAAVQNRSDTKAALRNGKGDNLVQTALSILPSDSKAYKIAEKYTTEGASALTKADASRLMKEVNRARLSQVSEAVQKGQKNAINEELVSRGVASSDAGTLTNVAYKALTGQEMTADEIALSEKSEPVQAIIKELRSDEKSSFVEYFIDQSTKESAKAIGEAESLYQHVTGRKVEAIAHPLINQKGQKVVRVQEITAIHEDGSMTVTVKDAKGLDSGERTITLDDISDRSGLAQTIFEAAASQDSVEAANAYIEAAAVETNLRASQQPAAFDAYYLLGQSGIAMDSAHAGILNAFAGQSAVNQQATEAFKKIAYEAGKTEAAKFAPGVSYLGRLTKADVVAAYQKSLGKDAGKVIDFIDAVSKKYGMNVQFAPLSDKNNGGFVSGTNRILLGLDIDNGTLTRTMGHEMFHYLSEVNTKAAIVLQADVIRWLKQKGTYEQVYGDYAKRYDTLLEGRSEAEKKAYLHEEIAADSCFDALSNDQFLKDFEAKTDKTIIEKIAQFIRDLGSLLKKALQSFTASHQGDTLMNELLKDQEMLEHINAKFAEMLESAGENKQQKTAAEKQPEETIRFSRMNEKSFEENVDAVFEANDAYAKRHKGDFVRVMEHTPSVILDHVENAADLEVIIQYHSLYLEVRHDGALDGNYHNLGRDIAKNLPQYLSDPDAIVRMDNGRINLFTLVQDNKRNMRVVSVEMNTVIDLNSKYRKYNLILTVFPTKENYVSNIIEKHGIKVEYEKEGLAQVNPQLHTSLGIVNAKPSTHSISETTEKSNTFGKENISGVNGEAAMPEVKFSRAYDPNSGTNYVAVQATDIVGENIKQTDTFARKARLYLNQHFKGVVLPLAKTKSAYIRKEGINEVTNPARYLPYDDYRGKMLAVTELDNLLKSSSYLRWEQDDGRHPDVKRWLYYQTTFLFTDENGQHQVIQGEVVIKRIARGDCFYDITKIENITNSNIGQSIMNHYTAESANDVSTDSISETTEKSNTFSKENISDEKNPSVKYQLSSETLEEKQMRALVQQNEVLQAQNERLKKEVVLTKHKAPNEKALRQYMGGILNIFGINAKSETFNAACDKMRAAYECLANIKGPNPNETIAVNTAQAYALGAASDLVQASKNYEVSDGIGIWNQKGGELWLAADVEMELARQLLDAALDDQVIPVKQTFADRQRERLNRKLREQSKHYQERLKERTASKNEQIEALKAEYRERIAKKRSAAATRELQGKITKLADAMQARLFAPKENRYIPKDFQGLIVSVLELLSSDDYWAGDKLAKYDRMIAGAKSDARREALQKTRNRIAKQAAKIDAVMPPTVDTAMEALYKTYNEMHKSKDAAEAAAYDPTIAGMLEKLAKELKGVSRAQMSYEQLEAVYQVMRAADKTVRDSVRLKNSDMRKNIFETGKDLILEVTSVKKEKSGVVTGYWQSMMSAATFFESLGGYTKNSAWVQLYNELNEAQRQMLTIEMNGTKMFDPLMAGKENQKNLRAMVDPKNTVDVGLKDAGGHSILLTHDMLVSLYLHLLNEDNVRHLENGGLTVPDMKEYYAGDKDKAYANKGIRTEVTSQRLANNANARHEAEQRLYEAQESGDTEAAKNAQEEIYSFKENANQIAEEGAEEVIRLREAVEDALTDYDRQWIETAQTFFRYSGDLINETTYQRYGFAKATIDNYFPIRTDSHFTTKTMDGIVYDMSIDGMGILKERVNASNPMLLEGIASVVGAHLDQVSKYAGLSIAVDNFNKLYNMMDTGYRTSVKEAIDRKFGSKNGTQYLEKIIEDLIGAGGGKNSYADHFLAARRGGLAASALTLNARVALLQTASYPTAAAVLGWKPLLKALGRKDINSKFVFSRADQGMIAKYTPLLWKRMQGYSSTNLGDTYQSAKLSKRVGDNPIVKKGLLGWINAMDGATVGRLWYAAQYYVDDNFTDLTHGSEVWYEKVAETFNRTVEQTQPNYTSLQRSALARSKNPFVKSLAMFTTQRFQNFNIAYSAAARCRQYQSDFKAGRNGVTKADVKQARKQLGRALSSLLVAGVDIALSRFLVQALLHNLKGYRDDDDELTAESITTRTGMYLVESLSSNILFGSEIYAALSSIITGDTYYTPELSGIATLFDTIGDTVNAAGAIREAIQDTDAETPEERWDKSLTSVKRMTFDICTVFGIPAKNAETIVRAAVEHAKSLKGVMDGTIDGEQVKYFDSDLGELAPREQVKLVYARSEGTDERGRQLRKLYDDAPDGEADKIKTGISEFYKDKYKAADEKGRQELFGELYKTGLWSKTQLTQMTDGWAFKAKHPKEKFSQTDELYQAFSTGKGIPQAIDNYKRYTNQTGKEADLFAKDAAKEQCRQAYIDGAMDDKTATNYIRQYFVVKSVNKTLASWKEAKAKKETKESFMAGDMTAKEAIKQLCAAGIETKSAKEAVEEWEREYSDSYHEK